MIFASETVREHLLRGLVGLGCVAVAVRLGPSHPWVALVAAAAALVALRGCPMCWTMGLVETLRARTTGTAARSRCVTGTCPDDRR